MKNDARRCPNCGCLYLTNYGCTRCHPTFKKEEMTETKTTERELEGAARVAPIQLMLGEQ